MQYFGGKAKIADQITTFINPMARHFSAYVEPFVGGANILCKVNHPHRIAGDANAALICMYKYLQAGWLPPTSISEEEYKQIRIANDAENPLTAFVGFGCSFAGKWFGGYARGGTQNYANCAANSLARKRIGIIGVRFYTGSYLALPILQDTLIYCDPPYAGTTGYSGVKEKFDTMQFWEWCRKQSRNGNCVLVSEYTAPDDFASVLTINTKTDIRDASGAKSSRREELFTYAG